MTTDEAQHVLLRAFLATGELPKEIAALLRILIDADEAKPGNASKTR